MGYLPAYLPHIFMEVVTTINTLCIYHNCCILYSWNSLSVQDYQGKILCISNGLLFGNALQNQFFYILSKDIN